MSNSKRKRAFIPVRTIPLADEEMPNFCKNLKEELLREYKNKLGLQLRLTKDIHSLIDEKLKYLEGDNQNNQKQKNQSQCLSIAHAKISRGALIESFTILDEMIGQALHHYQLRNLKRIDKEIRNWQEIEDGLNGCLNGLKTTNEFKSCRSLMQSYRTLRHQFAHNPVGVFSFTAKKENFESFLIGLKGIKLGTPYHVCIDGKAGVFICYNIESDEFLIEFFDESVKFYSMLLEILLPTDTEKALK
ncbi:MAG: hypothetical protein PHP10_00960 [Candidatus Omnitrophica bacterium]|nr:hypothetical protein [Candidatus Omnitrophota bacterium]